MQRKYKMTYPGVLLLLILAGLLSACSARAGSPASSDGPSPIAQGPTVTATAPTGTALSPTPTFSGPTPPPPPPCATPSSAKTEAWIANNQVVGCINASTPAVLSSFTYPLGLPGEGGQAGNATLGALFWAPDARHLAVIVQAPGVGGAAYPYLVDTTTHAVTRVPLPSYPRGASTWSARHLLAWADARTLLVFAGASIQGSGGTVSYRYDLTTEVATPLPGVTSAAEGLVRGSTLFYLELTPLARIASTSDYKGSASLHRYDLMSQREGGTPLRLGETYTFDGAEGAVFGMGWDVSPDGSHLVYQQTIVANPARNPLVFQSQFFAANADGSGASAILGGETAATGVNILISPNGRFVVVTGAEPKPDIFSGSIRGGRAYYYTPDASGIPTWLADNSGFEVDQALDGAAERIVRYTLNTSDVRGPGLDVLTNANHPAILA